VQSGKDDSAEDESACETKDGVVLDDYLMRPMHMERLGRTRRRTRAKGLGL